MRSQKITPEIRKAIREWYRTSGLSQEALGELVGINKSSVNGWLNGDSKNIRPRNWEKLWPHIKTYVSNMHVGDHSVAVNGAVVNSSITNGCAAAVENFRRRVQEGVMAASDIDDSVKVKIFNLVHDIKI